MDVERNEIDLYSFATYGRGGASARVRLLDWFEHLHLQTHHYDYLGLASNHPKKMIKQFPSIVSRENDLRKLTSKVTKSRVIISREVSPFSSGHLEKKLLNNSLVGIYDFDDAVFSQPSSLATILWPKKRIWDASVNAADVVIAGSEYLADVASNVSSNVVYIPSCVEPANYMVKSDYSIRAECKLVWLGSPSTEHYLSEIEIPLLQLHKEFNIRLTVISSGSSSLGPLDSMIDRVEWREDTFSMHLSNSDIGIMPLIDDPYSRGKCAYKILQYAASGLPLVASPIGANSSVVETLGAFPASNNFDWYEILKMMILSDNGTRNIWGTTLVKNVTDNFSFESWSSVWKQAVLQG